MVKSSKSVKKPSLNFADIEHTIGYQLVKIVRFKRRFVDQKIKTLGLSRTQWQVLLWLRILGPCSQKELLNNLEIDAAHLTRVLEDFEKKNYITRAPIEGNRRCLFITITKYCKQQILPHLETTIIDENTILEKDLTATEQRNLKTILKKLENNITSALTQNTE